MARLSDRYVVQMVGDDRAVLVDDKTAQEHIFQLDLIILSGIISDLARPGEDPSIAKTAAFQIPRAVLSPFSFYLGYFHGHSKFKEEGVMPKELFNDRYQMEYVNGRAVLRDLQNKVETVLPLAQASLNSLLHELEDRGQDYNTIGDIELPSLLTPNLSFTLGYYFMLSPM